MKKLFSSILAVTLVITSLLIPSAAYAYQDDDSHEITTVTDEELAEMADDAYMWTGDGETASCDYKDGRYRYKGVPVSEDVRKKVYDSIRDKLATDNAEQIPWETDAEYAARSKSSGKDSNDSNGGSSDNDSDDSGSGKKPVSKNPVKKVSASAIRFTEKAGDGKNNSVTIIWKKVSGVDGYEITAEKKGHIIKNTYKSITGDSPETIYTGNGTKITAKLARNTQYCFNIRSYKIKDGQKMYSDTVRRYYYVAKSKGSKTINKDMKNIIAFMKVFNHSFDKYVTVRGNTITLKKDITFNKSFSALTWAETDYYPFHTKSTVVLDFAGHKIKFNKKCLGGKDKNHLNLVLFRLAYSNNENLVLNDSVGSGGLLDTNSSKTGLQIDECGNIIINDGNYTAKGLLYFTSYKCLIINSGKFKSDKWGVGTGDCKKFIHNGGSFNHGVN